MQLPNRYFKLINIIWFQAIWFVAVWFQNQALWLLLSSIVLHLYLSPSRRQDAGLILLIAPIGMVADLLVQATGLIVFVDGPIPLWLLLLWCHFAVTVNHGFAWLGRFNLWMVAVMGGFAGASSYFGGAKLGAAALQDPLLVVMIHAAVWALVLPLFLQIRQWLVSGRIPLVPAQSG